MGDFEPKQGKDASKDHSSQPNPDTTSTTEPHRSPASAIEIDQQEKATIEAATAVREAKATQKETLDAVKKGERISLIIAAIVAFATIGQWITSCNNNASTSIQTDKLICAAGKNAAAADKFRIAAEGINAGVGNAVLKLDTQAQATQASARAAGSAADTAKEALITGQRALVSFTGSVTGNKLMQDGKIYGIDLILPWINSGSTPTRRAFSMVNFDMTSGAVMNESFDFSDRVAVQPRQFAIAPKGIANGEEKIPIQDFQFSKSGSYHLYIWGWITYHDIFKGTPTRLSEFCDEITNIQSTKDDMTDPSSDIKWNLLLCPVPHNCSDEECSDYKEKTKGT